MRKNPMLALVSNPSMRTRKRPLSLAERKRRRETVRRAMGRNASDEFHQRKHSEAIKESNRLERLADDSHIPPDARYDYRHSSTLRRGEAQAHYDSLIEPIRERGVAYLRLKRKILARQGMGENPYSRTRISSPREFDPRSFRTITPGSGKHKMVVGCPTGHYKHGRCDVGMEVQSVMRRRNPVAGDYGTYTGTRDEARAQLLQAQKDVHAKFGPDFYVRIERGAPAAHSSSTGEDRRKWHFKIYRKPRGGSLAGSFEDRPLVRNPGATRGAPISINDTELHTWFERDRAHVELRDKRTDKTLVEWWDDEVHQAIEYGFLDASGFIMGKEIRKGLLHRSAYDYWVRSSRRNPGAAWHGARAQELDRFADLADDQRMRRTYRDQAREHEYSKAESLGMGINPRARRNPGIGLSADDRARALKIRGVKPEMLEDPKFVSALAKHIEFHGEWPTDLTQREIKGIGAPNQVEYLVNMGKALDVSYKPVPGQKSNKAGSAWLHEFNEGKEDINKLPDRLCTGDGKTIITHGGKFGVKDWVRG